jgi:hypothetical protein
MQRFADFLLPLCNKKYNFLQLYRKNNTKTDEVYTVSNIQKFLDILVTKNDLLFLNITLEWMKVESNNQFDELIDKYTIYLNTLHRLVISN